MKYEVKFTNQFKKDLKLAKKQIKEYICQEIKTGFQYGGKYKSHDLVPSFYIVDQFPQA